MTVSVAPGVDGPVGEVGVMAGGAAVGRGVRDVVGGVVLVVVALGCGVTGGATTVSCCELLMMTRAITRPTTSRTATAARTHSHSRGRSSSGTSCGGWPGGG